MSNANWRGIVGVVKPTYKSGSLVDFIRLLPDGVGVVPLFIDERLWPSVGAVFLNFQRKRFP